MTGPPARNPLPLLVGLVAVAFLLAHFNLKPVVGDEGILAMDAWRMATGQIPHRDFFQFVPPMAGFLQAIAFKVMGPSVLALRLMGTLCGLLLLLLVGKVSSIYLRTPLARAVPLAVLVPFGVGVWPFASHHWWVDIFLLASLVALSRASEGDTPLRDSLVAGVFVGAGALSLQDQGGYALLGTLALVLPLFPKGRRLRCTVAFILGVVACALPPLAFLAWKAGFGQLFDDFVRFPMMGYHGTSGNRVNLAEGLAQVLAQWDPMALRIAPVYTSLIATASMVVYALPLLSAAALVAAWRNRWLPRIQVAILGTFCAAFFGAAFHRWSLLNLIWAASLPAVATSLALDRGLTSPSAKLRRISAVACALLLLLFCGFGALRIWAARTSRTFQGTTPAGSYRMFNPHEARELQGFCDAVEARLPPGEPAFCFGFCPLLNFVTGHPNPTRFNFLITPEYNGPQHYSQWMRDLEARRVRWGFSLNLPPDPADPADAYLRARYRPEWTGSTYILWKRIGDADGRGGAP